MGFLSAFQQQAPQIHHQAPEKFSCIILKYLESLDALGEASGDERTVTVIARSPSSAVIKAIVSHSRYFAARRVTVRVLFARFTPAPLTRALIDTLGELGIKGEAAESSAQERLRWLRHPRLLDAHEQLVMGTEFSWVGDALRRSEDRRNTLDIFAPGSTDAALLGSQSFSALWRASAPAPMSAISEQQQMAPAPFTASSGAPAMRSVKELHPALLIDVKGATRH